MTKNYICAEDAIDNIKNMMDYDGFRDGDCVSRRAVIGILDSMKTEITCGIDFAATGEDTTACITFTAQKGKNHEMTVAIVYMPILAVTAILLPCMTLSL